MQPKPKNVKVVCEACGLDWAKHGEKPTLATCVDLLKAELASRPKQNSVWFGSSTTPHWLSSGGTYA